MSTFQIINTTRIFSVAVIQYRLPCGLQSAGGSGVIDGGQTKSVRRKNDWFALS